MNLEDGIPIKRNSPNRVGTMKSDVDILRTYGTVRLTPSMLKVRCIWTGGTLTRISYGTTHTQAAGDAVSSVRYIMDRMIKQIETGF